MRTMHMPLAEQAARVLEGGITSLGQRMNLLLDRLHLERPMVRFCACFLCLLASATWGVGGSGCHEYALELPPSLNPRRHTRSVESPHKSYCIPPTPTAADGGVPQRGRGDGGAGGQHWRAHRGQCPATGSKGKCQGLQRSIHRLHAPGRAARLPVAFWPFGRQGCGDWGCCLLAWSVCLGGSLLLKGRQYAHAAAAALANCIPAPWPWRRIWWAMEMPQCTWMC